MLLYFLQWEIELQLASCIVVLMIKTDIALLNFPFKCRLVNEIRTSVLVHASKQANQLTSAIDCVENIFLTNFTESCEAKKIFFFKTQKRHVH